MKVCAQCKYYKGGGDWGLCCPKTYALAYEDTDACKRFEQAVECRNVSSRVGMFRCSICNAYCREERVFDTCPGCGNEITGAIWGTQKHYRGTK